MPDPAKEDYKICVDVQYADLTAKVAGVLFRDWADPQPIHEITISTAVLAEYEPGAFYKRELPCILELLAQLPTTPALIIIDGYVWLGHERPGLGYHLFTALEGKVPVIGVAKNHFHGIDDACALLRGTSQRPLFVTSEGMDAGEAMRGIEAMHGAHRVPTLIKRADQLCRADSP